MDALAYAVILEPEAEGGFSITVPTFLEIHTQGEDVQDALAMARDAVQLSMAVRRDEGEEIPAPDADAVRIERVVIPSGAHSNGGDPAPLGGLESSTQSST